MCVGAALGLTGIGATAFNVGLGLTVANAFTQRAAAQSAADQTYNQALLAKEAAERDRQQQQLALAERKAEEEKFAAQDKFAKTIDALQASRSIIASEQAGTTIGLLLMDQERQAANYRESVNQSLESFRRQYERNILATEADYKNRINQLQSNVNQAYNQIPSLANTLLNVATSGLNSYVSLLPNP